MNDLSLSLGIDYLTLILPVETSEQCLQLIDSMSRIFSDSYEFFRENGRFIGRQFANWARSPNGGLVVWNLPGENEESLTHGSMRIALGGTVLNRASASQIVKFISAVLAEGGKCSRIDLKCDDYSRSMSPDLLEKACNDGNITGFRKSSKHADLSSNDLNESGWTLYFGSRTSDRYTRYYNAKPVHDIEAWRYETEYKGAVAHEIAGILCNTTDEEVLGLLIAANIAGNISFIDRTRSVRADQCPMLDWWAKFIDRLGSSIRLSIPVILPTIKRSIEWLEERVSATLAMVSEYYGYSELELFKRLQSIGVKRQTSRHRALLEAASRESSRCITLSDDSFILDCFTYQAEDYI